MLEPTNRQLLLDMLRPPDGYALDRAVGTTFTLSLPALLAVPLALSPLGNREELDPARLDPLALLEGLRDAAGRVFVLCNAGHVLPPPPHRPMLSFLEDSVVQMRPPKGLFHPKMWLLRYEPTENTDGPVRYRLLVGSRNLTFDRTWDAFVVLDGELVDRKVGFGHNQPLGQFIEALREMAIRPPSGLDPLLNTMRDEVRRVRWELPEHVDELGFVPLGVRPFGYPFPQDLNRLLVISPFVSDKTLHDLANRTGELLVVSRADSLQELQPETFESIQTAWVLNDAASPEAGAEPDEAEEGTSHADALVGLHAKVYVADRGWDASVWIGSANATEAGLHSSVELLVELRGKRSKLGVDRVLGGEGKDSTLQSMLYEFNPADATGTPEEDGWRQIVEAARVALVAASLKACVTSRADRRFDVELQVDGSLNLPEHATVLARPSTLAAPHAVVLGSSAPVLARFRDLAVTELSAFFTFAVRDPTDDSRLEEITLLLPLEGAPADRNQELIRSLLSDKAKVLRYLLMLLAPESMSPELAGPDADITSNGGGNLGVGGRGEALFESLVRALEQDPRRLARVARLVQDLAATKDGAELLPEGFDKLWAPFDELRKESAS